MLLPHIRTEDTIVKKDKPLLQFTLCLHLDNLMQ